MTLAYHPYANIFPLIEGEAFAEFCEGLRADDRLHDKIVMLDGQILDGRNRYRACEATGVTPHFRTFNPEIEGDPLTFVISKNLHRRHLDDRQRASVAGEIAKLGRGRPSTPSEDNPPIGGFSAEQAGATLNVAPRQVERARVIHDQGVPELRDAFRRGDIAVSVAEKIARLPETIQPDAVARILPNGARAIMGSRKEPDDSLDYSPTPPWGTRALIEIVMPPIAKIYDAWEPACGEGHIAEVLIEYGINIIASDIHPYGYGEAPIDFLSDNPFPVVPRPNWIVTNPPFKHAERFALLALQRASIGVALFVRWQWIETVGRFERLFSVHPPAVVAVFAERIPLHMGRWEPAGSTATAYCWVVWHKGQPSHPQPFTQLRWIPPGQREALTRPDDADRFTAHPVIKKSRLADDGSPVDPQTGEIREVA